MNYLDLVFVRLATGIAALLHILNSGEDMHISFRTMFTVKALILDSHNSGQLHYNGQN